MTVGSDEGPMRAIALPIVILMLTATFAGCVGGDPDGDDSSGIDMEILNQMIDDNLQDFINNTTVTVNQDIHYYNNTTVVNNYSIGGSVSNGSGSIVQVMRISKEATTAVQNYGELDFVVDGVVQVPAEGYAPTMSYNIDGNIISLDFNCEEYINAALLMGNSDWREWAYYELELSWSEADDLSDDIDQDMAELQDEAEGFCYDNYMTSESYDQHEFDLFVLNLAIGESISFHRPFSYFNYILTCDDGYSESGWTSSFDQGELFGGWTDCSFRAYSTYSTSYYYQWIDTDGNSSINTPAWWDYSGGSSDWYAFSGSDGHGSWDDIIYFSKHFVVPVNDDE